ncbi:MAG: tRNA (N6-threonylcarbamoyladenosine(37)-N6)-methyltransferase TrmO [Bacteroidales bacterium]|nr:tRNA (N6-threonylcarbamoyladenosine(37)-N6)-methyltransferase TrmO [Bacteroidales bacterium]
MDITPIAHIRSPFPEKFGIPRQSGLAEDCTATVEFESEFRSAEAVRGLEDFSHIWLIWGFSEAKWDGAFTVRPPRLGGNTRIGVFASRSPYRPNGIGMSAVRLLKVDMTADHGPVLHVAGADLLDGTPIYDIKPYIPYADCIPEAADGYTGPTKGHRLKVEFAPGVTDGLDPAAVEQIRQLLELDPRVSYDSDPQKVWGMCYGQWNIRFTVAGDTARVVEISPLFTIFAEQKR